MIATEAFQEYQQLTGAKICSRTGLLTVTKEQFDNLQSLFFTIGADGLGTRPVFKLLSIGTDLELDL